MIEHYRRATWVSAGVAAIDSAIVAHAVPAAEIH